MKKHPMTFAFAGLLIVGGVVAAQPTIITPTSSGNTGAAPNGVAATTSVLLFTQPYCPDKQARGIYSTNPSTGASTLVTSLPGTACTENYLTISSGLAGFPAGATFATAVSPTNPSQEAVYRNGALFINGIPAPYQHAGITFDTSGTFGGALIVTTVGAVLGYNSSGTQVFSYTAPSTYALEGATVAPLTYAACPGCLFITAELASNINNPAPTGAGEIFVVRPGTLTGATVTMYSSTPGPEPEGLVFVTRNSLSCTNSGFSYFVSGYATAPQINNPHATNGAILAYTPAQLAPYVGQFLVPDETTKAISAFSAPDAFTTFSQTSYQLEASSILQCSNLAGCPATLGYWKHHMFPSAMFVGGFANIGCKNYSSADLLAILNTNNAKGNAVTILGHQLITALANYDAGATQTSAATLAIGQAITLLCSNEINLSSNYVAASSTLGQQLVALANILDNYNSSAPACEGQGLS